MPPEKTDKPEKVPTADELLRTYTDLVDRVTAVRRGL
jgi:hypothetical protein